MADELLFAELSRLPANELTAPRPIVFGSILRTLNHAHPGVPPPTTDMPIYLGGRETVA